MGKALMQCSRMAAVAGGLGFIERINQREFAATGFTHCRVHAWRTKPNFTTDSWAVPIEQRCAMVGGVSCIFQPQCRIT